MSDEQNVSAPVSNEAAEISNEGSEGGNEQTAKAPVNKAPEVNQSSKKKFKLKVDGQEEDFEIDLNDEKELVRHLQMSKAASKRMNEAAITRKQAEQFINALQNDPMRVLSDPRIMGNEKFQQIAEEFLTKKLQEQMLSPEERKRIEMEDKLRKYEEREKKQKEEAEQAQIAQLEQHYAEQYQKTIITALQSTNLPKNAFTVRRMAELMQKNIAHNLELEPQHLAQLVKEDYQRELASLIGGSDADAIISMFGEDVTKKIRKYDLDKLKASQSIAPKPVVKESVKKDEQPARKMRSDEYEQWLKSRM